MIVHSGNSHGEGERKRKMQCIGRVKRLAMPLQISVS